MKLLSELGRKIEDNDELSRYMVHGGTVKVRKEVISTCRNALTQAAACRLLGAISRQNTCHMMTVISKRDPPIPCLVQPSCIMCDTIRIIITFISKGKEGEWWIIKKSKKQCI